MSESKFYILVTLLVFTDEFLMVCTVFGELCVFQVFGELCVLRKRTKSWHGR